VNEEVIAEYRKHLDLTLIRQSLRLTPQQRLERLMAMARLKDEADRVREARKTKPRGAV
jgi:hypothetical protein